MNKNAGLFSDWSINVMCFNEDGIKEYMPFQTRIRNNMAEFRCSLCGYTFAVSADDAFGKPTHGPETIPNLDVYKKLKNHLLGEEYVLPKCRGFFNDEEQLGEDS